MPEPGGLNVRWRQLAIVLRRLRDESGYTGDQVGEELEWSASKVSRIETGRQRPRVSDVRRLLQLYDVPAVQRDRLVELARDAGRKSWFERYSDVVSDADMAFYSMEAEAEAIDMWEPQVIPGLLQTEAYARAVIGPWQQALRLAPGWTEAQINTRMARQSLWRREPPPEVSIVMDESVLRRRYGSREVMRAQLDQLAEMCARASLDLRILALDGDRLISSGSFVLLKFQLVDDLRMNDLAYEDHLTQGSYIDDEETTHRYRLIFDELRKSALGPAESIELISETSRVAWAS